MQQKRLEGDMKGFVSLMRNIIIFCAFFLVLSVILQLVKLINIVEEPYLQAFVALVIGLLFSVYAFLYVKKYHYTITETEIVVVSLFGKKVLPIEPGLTYSQRQINPSWYLITVRCNGHNIAIRTKTEKEILSFLAKYGANE